MKNKKLGFIKFYRVTKLNGELKGNFRSIAEMCREIGIERSTYYRRKKYEDMPGFFSIGEYIISEEELY